MFNVLFTLYIAKKEMHACQHAYQHKPNPWIIFRIEGTLFQASLSRNLSTKFHILSNLYVKHQISVGTSWYKQTYPLTTYL